uniref:Uncharacterized protein n=1 Tax=Romanomermis culicivorax TaxID=13658 RepID=A0A915IPS4_ROMCU
MKRILIVNLLLLLSVDLDICQEDFNSPQTTTIIVESTGTVKTKKFRQKIVEEPTNVSAILGDNVRLKCKVADQAGSVVWSKGEFFLGMDRGLAAHTRYSMGREGYPLSARCISQGGKPEASLEFYISTDKTGENLVRHLVQDTPYEIMTHNELNDIESSI